MANNPIRIKYPAQIDTSNIDTLSDNVSPIRAGDFNTLRKAVLAIEGELGIRPRGIFSTVRARLDAMEAIIGFGEDFVISSMIAEADGTSGQDTNTGTGIKTGHIQDSAITTAKIANSSVTTAKIANSSVTTAKIANNSVTAAKIPTGNVVKSIIHGASTYRDNFTINEGKGIRIDEGANSIDIVCTVGIDDGYVSLQESYDYGPAGSRGYIELDTEDFRVGPDGHGLQVSALTGSAAILGPGTGIAGPYDLGVFGPGYSAQLLYYSDQQTIVDGASTITSDGIFVLGNLFGRSSLYILPNAEIDTWPSLPNYNVTWFLNSGELDGLLRVNSFFAEKAYTLYSQGAPNPPVFTDGITLEGHYRPLDDDVLAIRSGITDGYYDGYAPLAAKEFYIRNENAWPNDVDIKVEDLYAGLGVFGGTTFRENGSISDSRVIMGTGFFDQGIAIGKTGTFSELSILDNLIFLVQDEIDNVSFLTMNAVGDFDGYANISVRNVQHPVENAAGVSGTYRINMNGPAVHSVTINGSTYFTANNLDEGLSKNVSIRILADESNVLSSNLTFDSDWRWTTTAPTTLIDGYMIDGYGGLLSLMSFGGLDSDIIAAFAPLGMGT